MIVRIPSNSYSSKVEEGKVDMRAGRNKQIVEKKSYWGSCLRSDTVGM